MNEKAWNYGNELTEVIFVEITAERALNHQLHLIHGSSPGVVPLSQDLEVDLELLKQHHQMVQVLGQWQI